MLNDDLERQEALLFTNVGGQSSMFGDGVGISIELCQPCLKKKTK